MTNVIVDAGTDAKIAKFQKRGIELIDLALLEPVEVWGEGGKEKDVRRESMKIVADEMGASVVVNVGGGRGGGSILSPRVLPTFLQPAGSRPVTPSAGSSATSLHSQIALANANSNNSIVQAPIPQYPASQTTPPRSNIAPTAAVLPPASNSSSSSSNNPTPIPSVSPASTSPMSLGMISPPNTPVAGIAPGKRNLFNKLFNKKQSGLNFLSPSESTSLGSSGQQQPLARSQPPPIITTTGYNRPDSEVSPPPTFASFALSPAPVINKFIDGDTGAAGTRGAGMERSFGSRSDSMKRRSAPPPALLEPPSTPSSSNFGFGSPAPGVGGLTSPVEQQTTPTQMSVARGAQTKMFITVTSPTPSVVESPIEREKGKGHGRNISLTSITSPLKATLKSRLSSVALMGGGGGSQSNPQVHGGGPNVDGFPAPLNQKWSNRDASPHPSLNSKDRNGSRLSLVASTDDSVDSYGGGEGFPGNGHAPQQGSTTQAQAQSEIMMNLRQQQLQLRPHVLGIQPTFVSSNPSSSGSSNPNAGSQDSHSTTTENPDHVLHGQRALMYVWLVRRWMKKRASSYSGLGDSAVGFLGGVVGGLKGEKEKGKNKDKGRNSGGDHRDKPRLSHDGLATVTAPLMYGGVEVRFEWKRAKGGKEKGESKKKKTRSGRGRTRTIGAAESDGEVETSIRERVREKDDRNERSSIRGSGEGSITMAKERLKSEEKRKYRMSTGSLTSVTANSEIDGGELVMKKKYNQYDNGEDSDPEDSETPWICTLKLRRGASSGAGGGLFSPPTAEGQTHPPILQTQVLRIKVGTLSPTPHHPKVVAMLKVPFPLPDVEVERMGVVKRRGLNIGGSFHPQNPDTNQDSPYNGLVLTAEEIKDVVCSTGLWLVVREGFGGVGRVSRKGDGWRIRA